MSTPLYEITGELLELQRMLENGEADADVLNDTCEAVEGEFEAKAEGYGQVIRNLESDISAIEEEEARLKKKRESLAKSCEWLKSHMQQSMVVLGKRTVKGTLFNWSLKNNPPKVVVTDEDMIPFEFMKSKTTTAPDKTKIKEFLQSEEGADCTWAKLESDVRIELA